MLTNFKTVKQSIKRLKELEDTINNGGLDRVTKREGLQLRREHDKLHHGLAGIKDMERLPDALFVLDVGFEKIAIAEAAKLKIPVIAVVDTNSKPDDVAYVIPGNDDALSAINLYTKAAADAVLDARGTITTGNDLGDDFVELDASGAPLQRADESPARKAAGAPRRKPAVRAEEAAPVQESAGEAAAE
jgi:small subunit ribosomal protein S2